MYVLQISINPGAPLGGSVTEYFPGYFNGTHFEPVDGAARIADFGKDNYAGQFFYGIPSGSNAVSISWASNWEYTQLVPTGPREGWRSSMSLPRQNFLKNVTGAGWDMVSIPYDMSPVLGKELAIKSSLQNEELVVDYSSVSSNALYLEVNATNINPTFLGSDATLNFTFRSPISHEYIEGGFYFAGDNNFFLNRGGLHGFANPFFTDKFSTTTPISADGTWSMVVVIDRSIIELFLDGGARSATATFYPVQPLTELAIRAGGISEDMAISITVRAVESAWAQYEDKTGLVVGNVSACGRQDASEYTHLKWQGSPLHNSQCANPSFHIWSMYMESGEQ
jgi:beta-fructofuranosidase